MFDLRTAEERQRGLSLWLHPPAHVYVSPKPSLRPLIDSLLAGATDAQSARAHGIAFYARMPALYRNEYAALFTHLAAGDAPVLFHCTAGPEPHGGRGSVAADGAEGAALCRGRRLRAHRSADTAPNASFRFGLAT